jgi:threonine/homoserine/homoserine lactone efflux protein
LALGFAIAATPGPLFFICLRRALSRGWAVGVASGLGVATADGLYAAVGAIGVGAITTAIAAQNRWLRLAGGALLLLLGARMALRQPANGGSASNSTGAGPGLSAAYVSTLGLTLSNPMTILSFAAVFASLGLQWRSQRGEALMLVAGVPLGSACWWLLLATAAEQLRIRLSHQALRGIGVGAGVLVAGFGAFSAVAVLTGS